MAQCVPVVRAASRALRLHTPVPPGHAIIVNNDFGRIDLLIDFL